MNSQIIKPMLDQNEIEQRLNELQNVLEYDSNCLEKHFSSGERIAINQERGSLFEQLNFLNGIQKQFRQLEVSKALNGKIEFVLTKIRNLRHK
ncbi:hypothetical protein FIA58_013985 [Flavobacterium jejuense]|uniref:Uncharacterized protein n=1 Tax=Flavobacterium jejuense TaxID=1544455 RepID=A0ABX0IUC1_9FLAO|nr:hypothetical protein [Flavobacterium jejuense]NHN26791.1 hypothetical protein [Flavobacterium jejuense]